MRRMLLALAALLLLAACNGQPQTAKSPAATPSLEATVEPSPEELEPTEEPDPMGDETPYVVFPEVGAIEIASACQTEGPDGPIYRGDLENGGALQLVKLDTGALRASALPAPEADPVGTNVPSDTEFTEGGGWLSGTSVMWLPESENNITVEYHVRWDDSIPAC